MTTQEKEYIEMTKAIDEGILRRLEIQNGLIADIESDIRIVKDKINNMKDEYRQYDDDCDFVDRLDTLYGELGSLISKRDTIKKFPFFEPNPTWVFSETNSDPDFIVGYETEEILDYGLDRLNKDL